MSTELDETVFEKKPDLRQEYSENAEAIPESERKKVDFFWLAETTNGIIPQYTVMGEENSYTEVREAAERGELDAFYWVPIDSEAGEAVGVDTIDGSEFRAFRRGRKKFHRATLHSVDDRVYVIEISGTLLVVNPSGKPFITENSNFHPRDFI